MKIPTGSEVRIAIGRNTAWMASTVDWACGWEEETSSRQTTKRSMSDDGCASRRLSDPTTATISISSASTEPRRSSAICMSLEDDQSHARRIASELFLGRFPSAGSAGRLPKCLSARLLLSCFVPICCDVLLDRMHWQQQERKAANVIEQVLGELEWPVWLVTAADEERRGGLIATFVNEASIVPSMPRMVVGLANHHYTWSLIESSDAFALHLLNDDQMELVAEFGMRTGHEADKLSKRPFTLSETGSPILSDAPAWLDCRVEDRLETGDRTLYLAEVIAGKVVRPFTPMTNTRMLGLASHEQRRILRERMERDREVDAAKIAQWRAQRAEA